MKLLDLRIVRVGRYGLSQIHYPLSKIYYLIYRRYLMIIHIDSDEQGSFPYSLSPSIPYVHNIFECYLLEMCLQVETWSTKKLRFLFIALWVNAVLEPSLLYSMFCVFEDRNAIIMIGQLIGIYIHVDHTCINMY